MGCHGGRTNLQGKLILTGLEPGTHEVVIRKANYQESRSLVTLPASGQKQLVETLLWAGGYLTVLPGVSNAAIDVPGLGHFVDQVTDLPCPRTQIPSGCEDDRSC